MSPNAHTTSDAARAVGISRATLQVWIAKRKIVAPKVMNVGRSKVRIWKNKDITLLRAAKKKLYRKGEGRPRKKK